jgi:protein TonB
VSVAEAFVQTFPAPEWWQRLDASQRVFSIALAASIIAHAGLLAVRFGIPDEFRLRSGDVPLDVILVNAKHASKPTKAEALAQANLDGGGEAAKGRATSFLTASRRSQDGDQLQQAAARMQQLEAEQRRLMMAMTETPNKIAAPDPRAQQQPDPAPPSPQTQGADARNNAQALMRQEAEIAKRIADENARPKRGYITPATREVEYAAYLKSWADRIETIGNNNYPEEARGRTYQLLMTVSVLANGRVEKIEIARSSGSKSIDAAAQRIVQRGQPFKAFPKEIIAKYGVLDLTMTWTFSRSAELNVETQQ